MMHNFQANSYFYATVDTLVQESHLRCKHSNIDLKSPNLEVIPVINADVQCEPIHEEELRFYGLNNEDEHSIEVLRDQNAKCVLKTMEGNLLTQNCRNNIVEDSTELVRGTVKAIKGGLQDCLENGGIDFGAVPGLNELFEEENLISNPFEHVSTKYQQNAYFQEHFGLVVSY